MITFDTTLAEGVSLSNGNLTVTSTAGFSPDQGARGVGAYTKFDGKVCIEFTFDVIDAQAPNQGAGISDLKTNYRGSGNNGSYGVMLHKDGKLWVDRANVLTIAPLVNGDVVMMALDFDNRRVWVRNVTQAGNWNDNGTADPATNAGGILFPEFEYIPQVTMGGGSASNGHQITANFGDSSAVGTVPAGFTWGWAAAPGNRPAIGYVNYGGRGPRVGAITVTTNLPNQHREPSLMVNGQRDDGESGFWVNSGQSVAGFYVRFAFSGGPRIVTEFMLRTLSGGGGSAETWQMQGYDSATSSWVNIGSPKLMANNADNYIDMSSNSTAYEMYQLLGVSGTSNDCYWNEAEFKISGVDLEVGDRRSRITLTTDLGVNGTYNFTINGRTSQSNQWFNGGQAVAGKEVKMVFDTSVDLLGAVFVIQGGAGSFSGTWKWQRSDDAGASWVEVSSSPFVWDMQSSGVFLPVDDSDGTTSTHWRLLGVSGNTANTAQNQIYFAINATGGPGDLLLTGPFVDESEFDAEITLGLGPILLAGDFFDDTVFAATLTLEGGPLLFNADFVDDAYLRAIMYGVKPQVVVQTIVIVTGR